MMLDGLEVAAEFFPRSIRFRRRVVSRSTIRRRGYATLSKVYGKQTEKLLNALDRLHPLLRTMIVEDVYGRVIARPGMTLRERELVNLVVLTVQGLEKQLYSHLRGALRMGVSPTSLRSLLRSLPTEDRAKVAAATALLQQLNSSPPVSAGVKSLR
jgi:alkylhydroperoxidase/carboxymuconolactone decarboxylase family protein YurZ